MEVIVYNNFFEVALKAFIRLVKTSGLATELKKHESFIPWTERRRKAEWRGRQRWLKRIKKDERPANQG